MVTACGSRARRVRALVPGSATVGIIIQPNKRPHGPTAMKANRLNLPFHTATWHSTELASRSLTSGGLVILFILCCMAGGRSHPTQFLPWSLVFKASLEKNWRRSQSHLGMFPPVIERRSSSVMREVENLMRFEPTADARHYWIGQSDRKVDRLNSRGVSADFAFGPFP